jgi:CheY-like chemotaxis protein
MRQQHREPLDPPHENRQAAAVEPTVGQLRAKVGVLVVDDDHLVRIMVQLGLERNGFEVWLAPNGREAIELYREQREHIAVVLLDVRLPGLDGPSTLDALRKLHPEVRACFMSGATGDYEPDELIRRGAAYVVAKPFLLNDLANILRLLAHGAPVDLLRPARYAKGEPGEKCIFGRQ